MTNSKFIFKNSDIIGFELTGHSGAGIEGNDIVCAAVSSAAYLTVNSITDIMNINANVTQSDGFMSIFLEDKDVAHCQHLLRGLYAHLTQLQQQYPQYIKLIHSEV